MSLLNTLNKNIFIIVVGLIIIIIAVSYFVVYPSYQEYREVRSEFDFKDEEILARKDYLPKLESIEDRIAEFSDEIKIIDQALPVEPSIAALFKYFQEATAISGLILDDISITTLFKEEDEPEELLPVREMKFSASVIGSYAALKLFLEEVYLTARIIEVESISFSVVESTTESTTEEILVVDDLFNYKMWFKTHAFRNL